MMTKKQRKACGQLVVRGYAYTPNCEEIPVITTLQVGRDGGVEIVTKVGLANHCHLDLEQILAELVDLGGVGISLEPGEEEAAAVAEWLAQIAENQKDDAA